MAFTKDTNDYQIIQALDDQPSESASALKVLFDKAGEDLQTFINAHIDELEATTNGSSGADSIGATQVSTLTGETVQSILEALKDYIDTVAEDFVSGTLADNSVADIKKVSDARVGSLATLTTTEKSSAVGAINEVDANVDTNILDLDNIKFSQVMGVAYYG